MECMESTYLLYVESYLTPALTIKHTCEYGMAGYAFIRLFSEFTHWVSQTSLAPSSYSREIRFMIWHVV